MAGKGQGDKLENQSEPGDEDEEILNPDDLEETEDLDQLEGTRQREDRRRLEDDIRRERGRPLVLRGVG